MGFVPILFILSQKLLPFHRSCGLMGPNKEIGGGVNRGFRTCPIDAANPVTSIFSVMEHEQLTETIIGCAMKVHRTLGPGFLESVYQKALAHELQKSGMHLECEKPIQVRYDNVVVGNFAADMFVEDQVLVENKAVQSLVPAHEVQLVNYLTATGVDVGLLLNFGAEKLEFKRKHRTYRAKEEKQTG